MLQSLCFVVLLFSGVAPLAAVPTGSRYLSSPGRFWHITDLHLDPTYHLTSDPTKVCFSSKGAPASQAGVFGDFLCDAPYQLICSAFAHMAPLTKPQDFIIWTGDNAPHVPVDELSTDVVIQLIQNMTETIQQHFPNLTVYPTVGNHDYWPQDQLPTSTNAIYRAAAKLWRPWLQADALMTLSQGGFYSQLVKPGLRVVSLNTILYYGPNKAVGNHSDPAGQFDWLEVTLKKAAVNLEKVFIIAHVPVGFLPDVRNVTAMTERHNERLLGIFRRYSHVIAGQFYGHTHRDSIMVLLNQQGDPVGSLFVSPAVTPIKSVKEPYSNNPSFRVYSYDLEDFSVLDIWQYFLNLTEANLKQSADWRMEYVMTEAFGLPDLRPRSLFKLGLSLIPDASPTFHRYFTNFMVSYNSSLTCRGDCKLNQLCAVLHLDSPSYSRCVGGSGLGRTLDEQEVNTSPANKKHH